MINSFKLGMQQALWSGHYYQIHFLIEGRSCGSQFSSCAVATRMLPYSNKSGQSSHAPRRSVVCFSDVRHPRPANAHLLPVPTQHLAHREAEATKDHLQLSQAAATLGCLQSTQSACDSAGGIQTGKCIHNLRPSATSKPPTTFNTASALTFSCSFVASFCRTLSLQGYF